jgi:hypothetical protein
VLAAVSEGAPATGASSPLPGVSPVVANAGFGETKAGAGTSAVCALAPPTPFTSAVGDIFSVRGKYKSNATNAAAAAVPTSAYANCRDGKTGRSARASPALVVAARMARANLRGGCTGVNDRCTACFIALIPSSRAVQVGHKATWASTALRLAGCNSPSARPCSSGNTCSHENAAAARTVPMTAAARPSGAFAWLRWETANVTL